MSKTQLEHGDTPQQKKDKYLSYISRNIKKFEFYCQQSDYEEIASSLKLIREKEKLETNSDVFVFLLRMYVDTKNA